MEQRGRDILSKQLKCSSTELLLWKVYTDKDTMLRTRHIQDKMNKRPVKTPASKMKCGNLFTNVIFYNLFPCLKILKVIFSFLFKWIIILTYYVLIFIIKCSKIFSLKSGTRKRFIQLLHNQKTSVSNHLKILKTSLPETYKLLTVYILKHQANPNKPDDR